MAKFCTRCGKPLAEGQVCDCMSAASPRQPMNDESTVILKNQQGAGATSNRTEEPRKTNNNPYDAKPQGNPYGGQSQGNPYGGQPQGNPYGGQPQGNPYGGQPQGNPYGGQPQGNPYGGWQGNPYGGQPQGNPYGGWQGNPYGGPQGGYNSQWIHEKTGRFVKNTKNMFAEILPLITKPDTTIKRISDSNSPVMGLEMVGLKALVCILVSLFMCSKIKSMTGGYFEIPMFRILIFLILITVGFAYMQAGIFKGMTMAFGGETTLNKMMSAIGFGAFVDSVMLLLTALFIMSFPKFAVALMMALTLVSSYFYIRGYEHSVKMQPDRKVYCFIVSQILTVAAVFLVLYVVVPIIFDIPLTNFADILEGFM